MIGEICKGPNLNKLKDFFDVQGKYPELFTGVQFHKGDTATREPLPTEVTYKTGLTNDNSRFLHINGRENGKETGTNNWKNSLGEDFNLKSIINIARAIDLHHYINHLPEGYRSELLAGGLNVPRSVRAKIILARAIVANPSLLVIDNFIPRIEEKEKSWNYSFTNIFWSKHTYYIRFKYNLILCIIIICYNKALKSDTKH